ncbi:MAG: DEAD/DEAH box helicase, partial [Deltaproteobacteria bacterium]|nr:DEAD/DEAH box helicase [Deltaproteobacteria bacterium]
MPEATPNPDSPVDVGANVGGNVDSDVGSNVDVDVTPTGFEALGLDALLVATLRELEYRTPTPIQVQSIPPLIAGRD